MESKLKDFLENSPVAAKAGVRPRIIVYRDQLSTLDLDDIRKAGFYEIDEVPARFELEAGGVIMARGVLKQGKKKSLFKITETFRHIKEDNDEQG